MQKRVKVARRPQLIERGVRLAPFFADVNKVHFAKDCGSKWAGYLKVSPLLTELPDGTYILTPQFTYGRWPKALYETA